MKQTCKKACRECPFKKDSVPGWLGPWKDAIELHRYVMAEHNLACHMTVEEDGKETSKTEHCVGSILYMNKNFKLCATNQERKLLQVKFKEADKSNILSSPEFVKHHDLNNFSTEIKNTSSRK